MATAKSVRYDGMSSVKPKPKRRARSSRAKKQTEYDKDTSLAAGPDSEHKETD